MTNEERVAGYEVPTRHQVPTTLARRDADADAVPARPRPHPGPARDGSRTGPSRDLVESWLATMSGLRPYEQKAIRVRYLSGLSPAEAAETMGLSDDAMALTVGRAIETLQRALEDPSSTGDP